MPHDTTASPRQREDLSLAEKVREQERARIARDLHDELGAHLTGIKMALALLRDSLPQSTGMEKPREHARYAEQLIDEAGDAMHGIIDDLCPPIVKFGLSEALEWQSRIFMRQTGIVCRQRCAAGLESLDEFTVIALFRIVREALTNVAKYASADQVDISVTCTQDGLTLRIEDNGKGFDPAQTTHGGRGLANMRRRTEALGGVFQLASALGTGTVIRVEMPVPPGVNAIE